MTTPTPEHPLPNGPIDASTPPFETFERQARRIQRILAVLLIVIAILPPCVFFFSEVSRLRAEARSFALHCAAIVASQAEEGQGSVPELMDPLQKEMKIHNITYIRLLGPKKKEVFQLGEKSPSFLAAEASTPVRISTAPISELDIELDDVSLLRRAVRVLKVHLMVATLLGLLIYRIPIRALNRAAGELEAAEAQLRRAEKLSAIGEMYAGLSHEINNPLAVVISRVKIMLARARKRQESPELIQGLEVIERHGVRIAEIVRGLLAFARKTSFQTTVTDVNGVVTDVVDRVARPFAKQDIQIRSIVDLTLPKVSASPVHLQQVLLNMLYNSRDAMPDGGTITLRTLRDRRHLLAEIKDTGIGIAIEEQEKLFEPFFTTKPRGTGLGLSVSYGIIKAHGGDIEVESAPGQGTLFRLMLPINGRER